MPEGGTTDTASDERGDYGGLFGAFPYAFRQSDSRLFRLYVVVGGALAALLGLGFAVSFVISIAQSTGLAQGGTGSFVRTFVVLVGFVVVLPLVAPVLFVARRHRRVGNDRRFDRALAATGFLFAASLYLAVVISTPPDFQQSATGLFAPVVAFLYGLPAAAGILPPLAAAALVYLVYRRYR